MREARQRAFLTRFRNRLAARLQKTGAAGRSRLICLDTNGHTRVGRIAVEQSLPISPSDLTESVVMKIHGMSQSGQYFNFGQLRLKEGLFAFVGSHRRLSEQEARRGQNSAGMS